MLTLLVHNFDSQIADKVCYQMNGEVLPIHDSFSAHPNKIYDIKSIYSKEIYNIYKDRKKILRNYCNDIGVKEREVENFINKNDNKEEIKEFNLTCLI